MSCVLRGKGEFHECWEEGLSVLRAERRECVSCILRGVGESLGSVLSRDP